MADLKLRLTLAILEREWPYLSSEFECEGVTVLDADAWDRAVEWFGVVLAKQERIAEIAPGNVWRLDAQWVSRRGFARNWYVLQTGHPDGELSERLAAGISKLRRAVSMSVDEMREREALRIARAKLDGLHAADDEAAG